MIIYASISPSPLLPVLYRRRIFHFIFCFNFHEEKTRHLFGTSALFSQRDFGSHSVSNLCHIFQDTLDSQPRRFFSYHTFVRRFLFHLHLSFSFILRAFGGAETSNFLQRKVCCKER